MPVQRPYFGLHQIVTGQYTPGNEFVLISGIDYIGQYHVLPTNQFFTGPRPTADSVEIFVKRGEVSVDIITYNNIGERTAPQSEIPIAIDPIPTSNDYQVGEMERFFVQKRNSPLNSIVEIDVIQFNKMNTSGNPGINGNIWRKIRFAWKISKLPKEDAYSINRNTIIFAENDFPGIAKFLKNPLEFYR